MDEEQKTEEEAVDPFNEYTHQDLVILMEEACEVAQAASKIYRDGVATTSNVSHLAQEIIDMLTVANVLLGSDMTNEMQKISIERGVQMAIERGWVSDGEDSQEHGAG